MARKAGSWKEGRRLRVLELHENGWTQTMIAEALGVTKSAVNQWLKSARVGGRDALQRKPRHGQAARLSEEQLLLLPYFWLLVDRRSVSRVNCGRARVLLG
ncbi:helix-turn-helix domain-containing protein [Sorangium sp. So ce1128]